VKFVSRIKISIEVWKNEDKLFKNYDVGAKKRVQLQKE
jgi:hypothetical protein